MAVFLRTSDWHKAAFSVYKSEFLWSTQEWNKQKAVVYQEYMYSPFVDETLPFQWRQQGVDISCLTASHSDTCELDILLKISSALV